MSTASLAIAFHIPSFEALDRQLDYESISDDPENHQRCVARERTLEMEVCRKNGLSHFLILDSDERRRIHILGHGAQNTVGTHALFTHDRQPCDSLAGYEVLLRSSVSNERSPLDFIRLKGGLLVADWPSQVATAEWYKHVLPAYLKRNLSWYRRDEVFQQDLSRFKDATGRLFCKSICKIPGCAGVTESPLMLFGYNLETMSRCTEIIVSEVLPLVSDELGKREYRCYVARNRVSSISRYIDYTTDYSIPAAIEDFAAAFVRAHTNILPHCYVLDIAETADRGPVVIELNPISASGRYERNDFLKLLTDLKSAR